MSRAHKTRAMAMPLSIAALQLAGLVVALVGDGAWDLAGDGLIALALILAAGSL